MNLKEQVEILVENYLQRRYKLEVYDSKEIEKNQCMQKIVFSLNQIIAQQIDLMLFPIRQKVIDLEQRLYQYQTLKTFSNMGEQRESGNQQYNIKMMTIIADQQVYTTSKLKQNDEMIQNLLKELEEQISNFNEFKQETKSKFYTYWVMLNDINEKVLYSELNNETPNEQSPDCLKERKSLFSRMFFSQK